MSTGERGRLPALDGVRGLAILLVVVAHVDSGLVPYGGVVGVTLFFVLSGYLITGILLREERAGGVGFGGFYLRRAFRLLPALLVVLAATPVLMWAVGDPRLGAYGPAAAAVFLYVGNFVRAAGGDLGPLGHTWSLSVEEQFYLLWPVVLVALSRWRRFSVAHAVTALAVVALLWRLVATAAFDLERVYFAPDTNAFALLFGCVLATRPTPTPRWAPGGAVAVLAVAAVAPVPLASVAVVAALAGVALVAAARTADASWLAHPVMRWFGRVSYGWYLWHQLLMTLQFGGEGLTREGRAFAAVLALGIAAASLRYIEEPILARALRQRARGDRHGSAAGDRGRVQVQVSA